MERLTVGVVIPTLEEEQALRRRLPAVVTAADHVVVSDGGSRDASRRVARRLAARTVRGTPGRGRQLNRGAALLDTDVLLFLHADTSLPPQGVEAVRRAIAGGAVGGGFLAHFDSPRPIFRIGSRLVNLRTRWSRAPLGDQAQFARRTAFEQLGGYRDWPILEDLDFIVRLRRHGRLAIIERPVTTSARRYEQGGIVRTVATNWLIWGLYLAGVSPHRLARLYHHAR